MSAAFCFIATLFLSQIIHEYVHVWQLRPYKPTEIILLGWKEDEEWGGWVKGRFDLTNKSVRRQEAEAAIITFVCMQLTILPYLIMLLRELGI